MVGCSSKKVEVVEEIKVERRVVRPSYIQHQVKYSGETLGLISRWYTGRTDNWKRIAEVNPSLKPSRISIGDIILIPNRLVSNSDPLPRKAVRSASGRSNASSAKKSGSASSVERQSSIAENTEDLESSGSVAKELSNSEPLKPKSSGITSSREKLLDELLEQ